MTVDLDALRAVCDAATPGPWEEYDAPGRTADEVIAALLETAARLRTGEVKVT